MKKPLIIFGKGKIADVVLYYATEECGYQVEAFVVDRPYVGSGEWKGRPVIALDEVNDKFPPEQFDAFVAVGYHQLNNLRATKCQSMIELGYCMVSIVSPLANITKDLVFGYNCFIMPPCEIHPCVKLGNNVFVWGGAMVAHHCIVEDNCWITSSVQIGGASSIGQNTFLALNATVGHGVTIGSSCFLGANTLVTKNMLDNQVVIAESSKPIKLNSSQFLRFSSFSDL
jgi:sugar O-acyltransferase (sialic acid O-acetyltransferase NeuD family)